LSEFDKQYQKYDDPQVQQCWSRLYNECLKTFDYCRYDGWINPNFGWSKKLDKPMNLTGCLSTWSTSMLDQEESLHKERPITTTVIVKWLEDWNPSRNMFSPYTETIKVGIILYALCGSLFTDSIWKKTTPFIYDGGRTIERQQSETQKKQIQSRLHTKDNIERRQSKTQQKQIQTRLQTKEGDTYQFIRPVNTYQSILFENQLSLHGHSTLMKDWNPNPAFWFKEISSPVLGFIGEIKIPLIRQKSAWGLRLEYSLYEDLPIEISCVSDPAIMGRETFEKELNKPNLAWSIHLRYYDKKGKEYAIGHTNALLFSNNTFFYIEPHGTIGQDGNACLRGDAFRPMWDRVMSAMNHHRESQAFHRRLGSTLSQKPESKFKYPPPQFVLHSEDDSMLEVQRIMQRINVKTGYCHTITFFIINLFSQNCSPDPQQTIPWTIKRFQDMIKIYMLIGQLTGSFLTDIRGFNVATMKTIKTLLSMKTIKTLLSSQKRKRILPPIVASSPSSRQSVRRRRNAVSSIMT